LYDSAKFNEDQAVRMKMALDGDNAYRNPPQKKFSKVKGRGKRDQDDEEDYDEDTNYLNMRDLRKKKPQPSGK
jgi:hypothetical protein